MVIMLQSYTHTDTLLPVHDGGWQLLEDGGHEEAGGCLCAPARCDALRPGGGGLRGQTRNLENTLSLYLGQTNKQDAVFIGSDCIDSYFDALSAL